MKKIIDGKSYNTDTAKFIASEWNGYSTTDFNHMEEKLYVTKKGTFFLYGTGGAMSKYATTCGDGVGGGSDIILLTEEEAQEWLEKYNFTEELEEYFQIEEG